MLADRQRHEYNPWQSTEASKSLIQELREEHSRNWVPPPCPVRPTPRPGESEVHEDDLLNYPWALAESCPDQPEDWADWSRDESVLLEECLCVEPDQTLWLELQKAREEDNRRLGRRKIEIEYGMHIRTSTKNLCP
jgi:hypothetical protein